MILVSGDITFRVQITCCGCGRKALSRHRTSLRQEPAADLEQVLLDEFSRCIPDIPVGWSMNGRDKLSCEVCTAGS